MNFAKLYLINTTGDPYSEILQQNVSEFLQTERLIANSAEHVLGLIRGISEDKIERSGPIIVHIDAHGDDLGIDLPDGSAIEWSEFTEPVYSLAKSLNRLIFLAFSSCESLAIIEIVGSSFEPCPILGFAGSLNREESGDFFLWFSEFYKHLLNETSIDRAVQATKTNYPESTVHGLSRNLFLYMVIDSIRDRFTKEYFAETREEISAELRKAGIDIDTRAEAMDKAFTAESYERLLVYCIRRICSLPFSLPPNCA